MGGHTGTRAERFAGDDADHGAGTLDDRQIAFPVVDKARLGFFSFCWQCHPRLDGMHAATFGASLFEPLRMRDAAACDHPVHFARTDRLLGAEAVAVHDLAFEQISDCRQTDVRMRPYVHGSRDSAWEIDRAQVIEKNEGSNHTSTRVGEHASDFKSAEVLAPLIDHGLEHSRLHHILAFGQEHTICQ